MKKANKNNNLVKLLIHPDMIKSHVPDGKGVASLSFGKTTVLLNEYHLYDLLGGIVSALQQIAYHRGYHSPKQEDLTKLKLS